MSDRRVCTMSGQRPVRMPWTTQGVRCPRCGASTYLTFSGKLYKHFERKRKASGV